MALSQKHEGKSLVPWFCSAEWHLVSYKIYGPKNNTTTRLEALNILNIWKGRTSFLSRGVEGTYIILRALLLDRNLYKDYNLKLIISSSVMRFLNICAAYNKDQGTFYEMALKMKLPEWLINIRHDIAHGQNLPSVELLDSALKFCLQWLYDEYWKPTSSEIKDYVDYTQFQSDKIESLKDTLHPIISNYCYTTLVTHSFWSYKSVRNIADEELRTNYIEEINSMIDNKKITEDSSLLVVLELLWEKIENILTKFDDLEERYLILAELITEDVFLGNFDERDYIFTESNEVPQQFINLWQNMFLSFTTELIEALIVKLVEKLTVDISPGCKFVAATWILEIGKALEKKEFCRSTMRNLSKLRHKTEMNLELELTKALNIKYGDSKSSKILNLNKEVNIPEVITNTTKFKNLVLEKPNEYTKIFLSQLLELNENLRMLENKKQILGLIDIYTQNKDNENEITLSPKIHKVDEFSIEMEVDEKADEVTVTEKNVDNLDINKLWRKVTEINFEKCPLGILPWQTAEMNPFLQ